jgi:hypothetical protein
MALPCRIVAPSILADAMACGTASHTHIMVVRQKVQQARVNDLGVDIG